MEENSDCLSKLREAIERCKDIHQLSQANKAAVSTKRNLKKMLNDANDLLKYAQEFLNEVVNGKVIQLHGQEYLKML